MLSNLGRAFQFLNCWKYCCFSQKQQPVKSFSPHPGFSSKTTNNKKTQPTKPWPKDILATTIKCYPSHKQNKHFFDKVPLAHQKILSNCTEHNTQTKADCSRNLQSRWWQWNKTGYRVVYSWCPLLWCLLRHSSCHSSTQLVIKTSFGEYAAAHY